MKMPGFSAEHSLAQPSSRRRSGRKSDPAKSKDGAVVPAFRVTCPRNPVLGATCTILGGGAGFFPCFGNSGCMWFHAGLINPACFTCSFS